jgi:Arc/MetJ-type ribon-helix-helix transcriptional regulator
MKRTTISLPDELAACVEREAARRRTSVSEVVRRALQDYLGLNRLREVPFAGIWDSGGVGPHAADLEDWLAEHWADDIARDSGLR